MKRDMELIRNILLKIEEYSKYPPTGPVPLDINGYSKEMIDYHIMLLNQANIIKGEFSIAMNRWFAFSLSWEGYELLDTIRDKDIWQNTKKYAEGFSLELIKRTATELIWHVIKPAIQ